MLVTARRKSDPCPQQEVASFDREGRPATSLMSALPNSEAGGHSNIRDVRQHMSCIASLLPMDLVETIVLRLSEGCPRMVSKNSVFDSAWIKIILSVCPTCLHARPHLVSEVQHRGRRGVMCELW